MDIIRANTVSETMVYEGFINGFSDYFIKMKPTIEEFLSKNDRDRNILEHSFLATGKGEMVGIILTGLHEFEGEETARCGGLAVSPKYRRQQLAKKLVDAHIQEAIELGVRQLTLEVLVENKAAIALYENQSYFKRNKILYFFRQKASPLLAENIPDDFLLEQLGEADIEMLRENTRDILVEWHVNLLEVNKETCRCLGIFDHEKLISGIVVDPRNRINYLWTAENYRKQGLASYLINHIESMLDGDIQASSFDFTGDNQGYITFLEKNGFIKKEVEQFQMFRSLE